MLKILFYLFYRRTVSETVITWEDIISIVCPPRPQQWGREENPGADVLVHHFNKTKKRFLKQFFFRHSISQVSVNSHPPCLRHGMRNFLKRVKNFSFLFLPFWMNLKGGTPRVLAHIVYCFSFYNIILPFVEWIPLADSPLSALFFMCVVCVCVLSLRNGVGD